MNINSLVILAALVASLYAQGQLDPKKINPSICGKKIKLNQARIIGGRIATEGEWKWQAHVEHIVDGSICGGSLINSKWIMTAASCVKGKFFANLNFWKTRLNYKNNTIFKHSDDSNPSNYFIRLGVTNLSNPDGFSTVGSKIIMHPSYNLSTGFNNLALIKLKVNIIVCLNNQVELAISTDFGILFILK